jgi:hypothetical protein
MGEYGKEEQTPTRAAVGATVIQRVRAERSPAGQFSGNIDALP